MHRDASNHGGMGLNKRHFDVIHSDSFMSMTDWLNYMVGLGRRQIMKKAHLFRQQCMCSSSAELL